MARGTDIATRLDARHTLKREEQIYDAIVANCIVPMTWAAVPVSHRFDDGTEIRGTVYVAERALRLGDETDSFRPNVNQVTQQRVCDRLEDVPNANAPDGVVMPTTKIMDAAAKASTITVAPCTQDPDSRMGDTSRMLDHSRCIDASINGRSGLSNQEGKGWVATNMLRGRPRLEANYGLFAVGARYRSVLGLPLWQPVGIAHISGYDNDTFPQGYTDYSQVFEKLVRRTMDVEGAGQMDIHDVAKHPKYCWLISTEGPMSLRHPAVPDPQADPDDTQPVQGARAKPPLLTRTLRQGMRGEDVFFVQGIVGASADGVFGPKTKAAVKSWQAKNVDVTTKRLLVVDGIVGPRTRKAMLHAVTGGSVAEPDIDDAFEPGTYDPSRAEFLEARYYNRHVLRDVVHWLLQHSAEAGEFPTTAEALARYGHRMADGRVVSWHWSFDVDSAVISVPEDRIAYHAKKANRFGIGYELAGYARQTREEWLDDYSESMLWIMATTAAKISGPRWNIPLDNFVDADGLREAYASYIDQGKPVPDRLRGWTTHHEVSKGLGGTHTDPGKYYPQDRVFEMVKEAA